MFALTAFAAEEGETSFAMDMIVSILPYLAIVAVLYVFLRFTRRRSETYLRRGEGHMEVAEAHLERGEAHMQRIEQQNEEIIQLLREIAGKKPSS
jgi:hypothetical protein